MALAVLAALDGGQANVARPGAQGQPSPPIIDDLPIMPGLSENEDAYVFDLFQGGRLAESRLSGDADIAVVRGFEAATLAQLGWRRHRRGNPTASTPEGERS